VCSRSSFVCGHNCTKIEICFRRLILFQVSPSLSTMTQEIPDFVMITPFGPYCGVCKISLTIERGMLTHGQQIHPDDVFKNAKTIRAVKKTMSDLRLLYSSDLSTFLHMDKPPKQLWFCTTCFITFQKFGNYDRHLGGRNQVCNAENGAKMLCFPTICGRMGPQCTFVGPVTEDPATPTTISVATTISSLTGNSTSSLKLIAVSSVVPEMLMTSLTEAVQFLLPFVRPDEDAEDLVSIFHPLLTPAFEGKMKQNVEFFMEKPNGEPILDKWIETGRLWLTDYAKIHRDNVSANVRSRLAEFEQKEMEGVSLNTSTFTLRRGVLRLFAELETALRFFSISHNIFR